MARKPGPRPMRGSPISYTAVSAPPEDLTFLMLYSGEGQVSRGTRNVIARLLKLDEDAPAMMRQAQWITQRAEELLKADGKEATQRQIYRFISDNLPRLLADWEER